MTTPSAEPFGHSARTGLWYRVEGQGTNVVLVSGLNGQARFWDPVRSRLAQDYRVLTFDQPGCGASPDDGADWTIETLANQASELADEVFHGEPHVVIGHSTGGAIAQCMASRALDRMRACVLSATWDQVDAYMRTLFELRLSLTARAPDLDPILGHLLRADPSDFTKPDASVALNPDVTTRRIEAILGHDGTGYLASLAIPTLVIGSEDDRIVPEHLVRRLHAQLAAADLVLLPRGGHFFPQTRTQDFLRDVLGWLRQHLPQCE